MKADECKRLLLMCQHAHININHVGIGVSFVVDYKATCVKASGEHVAKCSHKAQLTVLPFWALITQEQDSNAHKVHPTVTNTISSFPNYMVIMNNTLLKHKHFTNKDLLNICHLRTKADKKDHL